MVAPFNISIVGDLLSTRVILYRKPSYWLLGFVVTRLVYQKPIVIIFEYNSKDVDMVLPLNMHA